MSNKQKKKKLDKLYIETLDWLEKNKETRSLEILDEKVKEVQNEIKPIMDAMYAKINEANATRQGSTANISVLGGGLVSARSKLITPSTTHK